MPINLGATLLECSQRTSDFLEKVRDAAVAPSSRKVLRTWGIADAAAMVGKSENTLRAAEERHPELAPSRSATGRRSYTLSLINRYRDLLKTRYLRPAGSLPVICAVTNFKGGAGKTTTAIHLAQRAALDGLRVLVVDLDAQASLTLLFGLIPDLDITPEDTITDTLVSNPGGLMSIIRESYFTGIDLVPSNLQLQDCDLQLGNPATNNQSALGLNAVERLSVAIDSVKAEYDLVVIDCGPNLGLLTMNAVYAATGLLIPIPPSIADFGSADLFTKTMGTLLSSAPFDRPRDFLSVMVTKHTNNAEARDVEAMTRLAFKPHVLAGAMVQTVEVERAVNDFGTVYETEQPRGSSDAYRRALTSLNEANGQLVELFKQVWTAQAVNNDQ
jgi:chromosome partitioning protein